MKKLKVAVLFGGKSGEHEVSLLSAASVLNAIDKTKYDVTLIGIGKDGRWLMGESAKACCWRAGSHRRKKLGTGTALAAESGERADSGCGLPRAAWDVRRRWDDPGIV